MKRYTREEVKSMTPQDYESTICRELNTAGYRTEFQGKTMEYEPDPCVFGGDIVFNLDAVNYLKNIGLIDNGKCPMCCEREDDLICKLQSMHSGAEYHVCKPCYKQYAQEDREKRGCRCCIFILVFMLFAIYVVFKLVR